MLETAVEVWFACLDGWWVGCGDCGDGDVFVDGGGTADADFDLEAGGDLDTTGGAGVAELKVDGGDFVDWGAQVLYYY